MTPSRTLASHLLRALAVLLALLLSVPLATAQDDNPAQQVEALALRAHLQNLRTGSRTLWIGGSLGASGAQPPSPLGERFDPFVLPALGESSAFDSLEIERPVLLNFWASWCTPCRVEFPHLAEVALNGADHAFDVVFVNTADTEADALGFLMEQPPDLHTVADASGRLARRSLLGTIPTSLLVDTDGTVLVVHLGVVTPTVTAFLDAVAAHPGQGMFDASSVEDEKPGAVLEPFDAALAREIQLGERALGTLTDDSFQHTYRFEGRAGQRLRVEMTADSSELDPYLVVITADGTRLAENDDAGASVDAAVEVRLPADGPVIIVATRFLEAEGFSSGDYSLIVRDPAQTTRDGFLSYGVTVGGRVSGNNPRELYAFEGRAGDAVTLRVTHAPGDVSLQVELKGPDQRRLAISEPSTAGETALSDFELLADGIYRITVQRPRTRETDNLEYMLTLSAAD
mgnify:FL=1